MQDLGTDADKTRVKRRYTKEGRRRQTDKDRKCKAKQDTWRRNFQNKQKTAKLKPHNRDLPSGSGTLGWRGKVLLWKRELPSSAPACRWWSCRRDAARLETTSGRPGSAGSPLWNRTSTFKVKFHTSVFLFFGLFVVSRFLMFFLCVFGCYSALKPCGNTMLLPCTLSTVYGENDNKFYSVFVNDFGLSPLKLFSKTVLTSTQKSIVKKKQTVGSWEWTHLALRSL